MKKERGYEAKRKLERVSGKVWRQEGKEGNDRIILYKKEVIKKEMTI